jgi:hypothetical protein
MMNNNELYVVTAEGDFMDAECKTNDAEEAARVYTEFCESGLYYDVSLYDGVTGEVYAYQRVVRDPSGTTVTNWVAN